MIQPLRLFRLGKPFRNREGVQILRICEAYELGAGGLVPDIAFFSRGFAFLLLDPVKFLDQVQIEFNRYPRDDLAGVPVSHPDGDKVIGADDFQCTSLELDGAEGRGVAGGDVGFGDFDGWTRGDFQPQDEFPRRHAGEDHLALVVGIRIAGPPGAVDRME